MASSSSSMLQFKWSPGVKANVAFANLEVIKQYEPETYALFKQPLEDEARASDDRYDYRLRHHAHFGWSVTRFERTSMVSYGSVTQVQQQPPKKQQLSDHLTLLQEIRMKIESLIVDTQQQLKE